VRDATGTGKLIPQKSAKKLSLNKSPSISTLLVATRKGLFVYGGDVNRRTWTLRGPHFLGCIVHHAVADPRDHHRWLAAVRTGHLGPTIMRSTDGGKNWQEAKQPPAFPKDIQQTKAKAVEFTCWLTPGHVERPGWWYAGVSPFGLFLSKDHGEHWEIVSGFTTGVVEKPGWSEFMGAVPEGGMTHSIIIDPRNADHLYVSLSTGGAFETRDAGKTWTALNRGVVADFLPMHDPEVGHDPHCMVMHPALPDRLWQQNHCGIYRLDRPGDTWLRVGLSMPKQIGDIGFPIVLHPREVNTAWVIPMDGTKVWPRTSPAGRPAVYCTKDAGETWQRQDRGLPEKDAWLTVKRQAFCADSAKQVGLYFGSTSGSIWHSKDEGKSWKRLAEHLPHIYALTIH
jgi:photosystem II stability/assembly factor-like uncharacterized protein